VVMSSVLDAPGRPDFAEGAESDNSTAPRVGRALSSRVYVPACAIAAAAAVLVALGWWQHWGGGGFASSVTSLRVVLVGPLSLVIIGAIAVVERVWPAQQRSLFARGYTHDLLITGMNVLLVAPLITALALSFVQVVRAALPWIVLPRIGSLPRWGAIVAIAVAMDLCNWAVHRANHRYRMLWRFHELHHSQEDMNVLTVFRTHPLIHVSYLLALIPGVVLLANGALSITLLAFYGGIVAFAHSNTRVGFGPLGRVFVSPNYHRIHHQLDGPQDVNLGFALTIWDQLFHRAMFPTKDQVGIDTGLPGRPLAVEQAGAKPRHLSVLARQLVAPFRPMDARAQQSFIRSVSNPLERSADRPHFTAESSRELGDRGEVA
jgi:sterol desaturase/sphingolipid hydroxylase (fatty acid hydroxylase superfamily)